MTSHVELNPDDNVLGLSLGMKAMRLALTQKTHKVGTVRIPTGGDTDVIIGDGAQDGANRIDRDGNQLPLVDTSGIDKAAQDARKAADDAAAKADEAIKQGEQIRQDAQTGIDDARKQAQDAAAKADKARSDLQAEMDANKQAADNAIANVDKKAEQVKADASKISQRVDADKAALDKSIASVDAKAQAASDKGDQLAGQISDVTTTVNGHTTKLGELSTRIEGVASDGQTTVKSLTSLQQTVTGLSSTVSQNTKTASDAMSKVSQVEQTANGISANLSKNYTTTADADEKYAAKTELKATADGLQANITRSQQTADGAVTAASKAQATADGFGATLSKDYQTTAASDEKYSTKADLKATSDSISSSLSSVKQTADGAVTAASKAQQTADAVTLNLSKNYQTKAQNDAVYATKTSLKVTSDSLSASISSTAKTAQSAVDKATNLEANLNGFKTTVSQTYTTKTDFNNLTIGGTNRIVLTGVKPGRIDSVGNVGFDAAKNDHCYTVPVSAERNTKYTISGSITTPNGCYISVAFYDENGKFISRPIGAYSATEASWKYVFTSPANAVTMRSSFPVIFKGKIKLEKGTKPTDWSPAPEDLQPAGDYATNSSVTQTANSIKAQVTEVSKTANGAMSKATTVEQTANGLSSKITEQGKTLNATVKTANEAKSTADSNKATISQVSTTASNALSKASTVEQNLNGFKTTVSETYSTKDDVRNLTISGTNLLLVDDLIACYVNESTGLPVNPYAGKPDGNCVGDVSTKNPIAVSANSTYVLTAYDSMPDTTGFTGRISQFDASGKYINIALNVTIRKAGSLEFTTASTAASIYVGIYACPKYRWKLEKKLQPAGDYATNSSLTQTANQIRGEVSEKYQSKSGMSSYATTSALTQKTDEITGKVTEVAKTATGAMGKASSVEQTASALSSKLSETVRTLDSTVQTVNTVKSTADSNKATLTQVAKTASDASSRASSMEQSLNGFKTTVSQTYGRGSNLWVNPTFDPDKPQITSRVNNVTAPNGSGVNLLASRDHYNKATSFPVVPGHTYVITAHAKKIKGDISLNAGIWYTAQTSGNALDSIVHAESTSNLSDGWMASTWRFTCPDGKSRGCVYFQIEQWFNSLTTQWYVANVVCVDVTGLQPAGDYATKSYVNQNAKAIALGVVENYKGADGSGLATKSDITASEKSITSTVASTYATKSGVTQEISSKITQNNNSLDVKFSTKVETQNAQNKANTADSHATNAQSRVGSLEDCINFTASGVRVGKRSNGKFTGVSALVNTNGTFDLLDASGNLLTRINQHRFQVTGDDGTGSGYLSLSQDGINITVQPTADTSKTYHIQVGKSGVGITAPDGSSIECSASGGLNIETVKYGKISIGAGGLQFTNDQGWGLRLSAAGWSLKWAGNHMLATGPAAGKLYIDGREIVTR